MNFIKDVWGSITPWTRRIFIICCAVIIIAMIIACAMTGNLGDLIRLISESNG